MKKNLPNNSSGFLLISSLVVISTMIIIVGFYLNAIIQEVKISHITGESPQAYYLAESGIQEAVWKLQNDVTWRDSFETSDTWSASFTRNNVFGTNGSYTVTAANQSMANAVITATSTIPVRGTESQRVVKVTVFKAINSEPLQASSMYANHDITGVASVVNVSEGGLYANNNINLSLFSDWSTAGKAQAYNHVNVSASSRLTAANGIFDIDHPPAPESFGMPIIDFDSSDPNSYKSRANQTYTSNAFRHLLDDSPVVTLDGITYVTGNIYIKKGQTLTINGVLAADGSISVGNGFSIEPVAAILTINNTDPAVPSGLLSKSNITIGGYNSQVNIDGLIYSGGKFLVKDGITQSVEANFVGAIVAQDIEISISWQPIDVQLNQMYINSTLGEPLFSQVLLINHWEEEY